MASTFEEDVETWTAGAIRAGPTSFDDLVCHLPGVYPTEVRDALVRMRARGTIDDQEYQRALRRQSRVEPAPYVSALPVPHPLDFDWRFADDALDVLTNTIDRFTPPSAEILCLGTPSLTLRLRGATSHPVTFLDANVSMVDSVSVIAPATGQGGDHCCRLGIDPLPSVAQGLVVIDPPWYPEHFRVFIWAASQLCRENGHVLVSFPPAGTRPGVSVERDQALDWAEELGLELVEIRRGTLPYRSPPFEQLALSAAECNDLPIDWRRGDLLILRRTSAMTPAPAIAEAPSIHEGWVDLTDELTGIKVRQPPQRTSAAPVRSILTGIVEGDVLPTVSRRDPRRQMASVWTATNRVYACHDVAMLVVIARASPGEDSVEAVQFALGRSLDPDEVRTVRSTSIQLAELRATESSDLRRYGWLPPSIQ
jgi:hypothetical protein